MSDKITSLLKIQYPIIQAGMVWCSGWELASAVSNAGGLGVIGSGSMSPDILKTHIQKTKLNTQKPFAVNVPLLYSRIEETINTIIEEKVPIVITSAGNPATWTQKLKANGCKVLHVVSNLKFALKSQEAGIDAIIAEGVEAGGHNGREETTTMVLIPLLKQTISIPIVAAGGIANGRSMLAAMTLGADGVQVGSRFVACTESSAHQNFKEKIIITADGETKLVLKQLNPVRLIRNEFCSQIEAAESGMATKEQLLNLLGKGRSRKGMFEGDLTEGELEIGQAAAYIKDIKPAAQIIDDFIKEYNQAVMDLKTF